MGNPREKGKIPHSEWPGIQMRHRNGESLASIARDYRCTAPAIRYIVKREAAAGAGQAGEAVNTPRAARARATSAPGAAGTKSASARPGPRPGGITLEVQKRITTEISFFLVALDTALTRDTSDNLLALHDATDRLMRAAARIRIETERLIGAEGGEHLAGAAQRIS